MKALYNQILGSKKLGVCEPIDELIISSGFAYPVRTKLQSEGYSVSCLTDRECALLFATLVDLVYITTKTDFYIATANKDLIVELHKLGNLAPCDDGGYEKVVAILDSINISTINKYLQNKKFKLIKVLPIDFMNKTNFFIKIGNMRSYPTLANETVYSLQCLVKRTEDIIKTMSTNSCELKIGTDLSYCRYCPIKASPATGYINFYDFDSNVVSYKIWNINSISIFEEDGFIRGLKEGVIKYRGMYLTLNYSILSRYYTAKRLYQKLETLNSRRRLCYDEIKSLNINNYSSRGYIEKYALDSKALTIGDLKTELAQYCKSEDNIARNLIHPRVLAPIEQINSGYKSFYTTVNLAHVDDYEVVKNIEALLPQKYVYYAVSTTMGYNCVVVESFSEEIAMKLGNTEFCRQFGDVANFCSLSCRIKNFHKGMVDLVLPFSSQKTIWQEVAYGYNNNYEGYAKEIRLLAQNSLNYQAFIEDDCIKFLFANRLAKVKSRSEELSLGDLAFYLVSFYNMLITGTYEKELYKEYLSIADKRARKQWIRINALAPTYMGYSIVDTEIGKCIITDCAVFKINADMSLSKHIHLKYRGKDLGNILIK